MDTQQSKSDFSTEIVQCPYCHAVIKAPNQPGVTFLCSHCGKELITYAKVPTSSNTKQKEKSDQLYCYACGTPIPNNTYVCPVCGTDNNPIWRDIENPNSRYNINYRRFLYIIIPLILLLSAIATCVADRNSKKGWDDLNRKVNAYESTH